MTDIIFIRNLKVDVLIGVLAEERQSGKQTVEIDLEISVDTQMATQTDEVNNTVDYTQLTQQILNFMGHSQYYLIETLAHKTAEYILTHFQQIVGLRLTLYKPKAMPGIADVGIIIERGDIR